MGSLSIDIINDVDTLYEKDIIVDGVNFVCPVCRKSYKRKASLLKHMEKKDCYSVLEVFMDTDIEKEAYQLFKELQGIFPTNGFISYNNFRKGKFYKNTVLTVASAYRYRIYDIGNLITWAISVKKASTLHRLIWVTSEDSMISEYRIWRHTTPQDSADQEFIEKNIDQLSTDTNFLISSLEAGNMSFSSFDQFFPVKDIVESLTLGQEMRLNEIINQMEGK